MSKYTDVPVGAMMDEAQSQSERSGEEERERREMSERQTGTRREEDREKESVCDGRTPFHQVNV